LCGQTDTCDGEVVEDSRELRFITTLQICDAELFLVTNKNCKKFHANVQIKDITEKKKEANKKENKSKARRRRRNDLNVLIVTFLLYDK
jgi:hypothetical protein